MCDGDSNNDGYVNTPDQVLFRNASYSQPGDSNWKEHTDFDGDGYVSTSDVALFERLLGKAVVPAGAL